MEQGISCFWFSLTTGGRAHGWSVCSLCHQSIQCTKSFKVKSIFPLTVLLFHFFLLGLCFLHRKPWGTVLSFMLMDNVPCGLVVELLNVVFDQRFSCITQNVSSPQKYEIRSLKWRHPLLRTPLVLPVFRHKVSPLLHQNRLSSSVILNRNRGAPNLPLVKRQCPVHYTWILFS